jgi:hypothetical protein
MVLLKKVVGSQKHSSRGSHVFTVGCILNQLEKYYHLRSYVKSKLSKGNFTGVLLYDYLKTIHRALKILFLHSITEQIDVMAILDTCVSEVLVSNLRQDIHYLD